jgi:SAM-dependent methyltransferase
MTRRILRSLRKWAIPTWVDHFHGVKADFRDFTGLHVGCGNDELTGMVRLDIDSTVRPDVLWDLNDRPYPFSDNAFRYCVALSVIEHLRDFFPVMRELHRITMSDGKVFILVPHFSSAAIARDPTHRLALSALSCDYFVPGTTLERQYSHYTDFRFRLIRRIVSLQGALNCVPFLSRWISVSPGFWEDYLCYVLRGGAIYWELAPIKQNLG